MFPTNARRKSLLHKLFLSVKDQHLQFYANSSITSLVIHRIDYFSNQSACFQLDKFFKLCALLESAKFSRKLTRITQREPPTTMK